MRKKLWQLRDMQRPILGACLSREELRRMAAQQGMGLPPDAGDYQLLCLAAAECSMDGPCAWAVHEALDKKFAAHVKRFAPARDDAALRDLWRAAQDKGEVPGACWALLSHGRASWPLRQEVFEEVRMFSHLLGQDRPPVTGLARDRRVRKLEQELRGARQKYANLRGRCGGKIRQLKAENRVLRQTLHRVAKEAETLRCRAKHVANPGLRAENSALQCSLGMQTLRLVEMKSALRDQQRDLDVQEARLAAQERQAQEHAREQAGEIESLRDQLARARAQLQPRAPFGSCVADCADAGTDQCPGPLLCGKRIVYVGGKAELIRQYQEQVERLGGTFRHLRETMTDLLEGGGCPLAHLIREADAVLCPEDGISGDVRRRIQEACGNGPSKLEVLENSELSSLSRCLQDMARRQ